MLDFLVFIFVVSVIIIAHEFGHFIAARKSGVKVERFAIGFGKPIFKIKGKETNFVISAFPLLGGYVKLAGDSRQDYHGYSDEFLSKPAGIKMRIVFAGPLFSYLFAFILFWCIAVVGFPYPEAIIGKVKEGYPAQRVGLKEGDKILEVNAKSVGNWLEMTAMIRKSKSKVSLKVERDGESLSLDVPLEEKNINDEFGAKRSVSVIGIEPSTKIKIVRYNLFKGFFKGLETLFGLTFVTFKGFIFMILGKIPLKEAVTGPLGIYYLTSETVKMGISALMYLMAVLNISLFVVNLIPAPLLDGFHILVFFIEKIRKKQLSEKTEDFFARLGYVILGVLIIFVFYNDFVKFGPKFWGK